MQGGGADLPRNDRGATTTNTSRGGTGSSAEGGGEKRISLRNRGRNGRNRQFERETREKLKACLVRGESEPNVGGNAVQSGKRVGDTGPVRSLSSQLTMH